MNKKLTQDILDDYLVDAFTELRAHVELHHPECVKEMEQAYAQFGEILAAYFRILEDVKALGETGPERLLALNQLLKGQQKPTVSREWVDDFAMGMPNLHQNKIDYTEHKLKEIGVEVVE